VFSFPLAGILCATVGWPFAYYVNAVVTLALAGVWWLVFRDNPGEHPRVTITELREIQAGRETVDAQRRHNIPTASFNKK
jgi:predicted MFS family arabinose efflux permease